MNSTRTLPATLAPPPVRRATRGRTGPLLLRASFAGWVGAVVLLPLTALVVRAFADGPGRFVAELTSADAADALTLTLGLALVAAAVNAVAGTAIAWALVRWSFPGRRVLAAVVDLPFAIPTLVAGILIVALLGPASPLGHALGGAGIDVVYARPGMLLALVFVTLPFVVRAVEPVLEALDPAEEEAARMLGATDATVLWRVLLPPLLPAVATGAAQAFARAVGEFGAMAVVSGNLPHRTLTAPVHVLAEVEGGDTTGAVAVSLVLLVVAAAVQLGTARIASRRRA